MPRPRNTIPSENVDAYIPITTMQQVRDRLYDPRLGRMGYGAIGTLITQLLDKWVKETPIHPTVAALREKENSDVAERL